MTNCISDGCNSPARNRNWCGKHYERWRKYGDTSDSYLSRLRGAPLAQRFWRNIDQTRNGCWEWPRSRNNKGYGRIYVKGRLCAAHRVSWEITKGKIPADLHVLHRCDNPSCIRPEHLFLGSNTSNMQDMIKKGRARRAIGERNCNAKVTASDVINIRKLVATGTKQRELGRLFGVSENSISCIVNRKTWRHLP